MSSPALSLPSQLNLSWATKHSSLIPLHCKHSTSHMLFSKYVNLEVMPVREDGRRRYSHFPTAQIPQMWMEVGVPLKQVSDGQNVEKPKAECCGISLPIKMPFRQFREPCGIVQATDTNHSRMLNLPGSQLFNCDSTLPLTN